MKVAIVLRGYHYGNLNKYYLNSYDVDFRKHVQSFFENIYNPLRDQGHEIDIILATENSPIEEELKIYNPKVILYDNNVEMRKPFAWPPEEAVRFQKSKEDSFLISSDFMKRIYHCQQYIRENNLQYDAILVTRFDVHMYKKITELNLDLTKTCWYCECSEPFKDWVDDNLFVMPQDIFMMLEMHLHFSLFELKKKIPGFSNYQYLVNGRYEIARGCPDYQLGWMIQAGWPLGTTFRPYLHEM